MIVTRTEYPASPAPKTDLHQVADNVIGILATIEDMRALDRDLAYLRRRGISTNRISRVLNIRRANFWDWTRRGVKPRSLYYALLVREWARKLREQEAQEKEQRSSGPSVYVS
jgi:hypothetical protein